MHLPDIGFVYNWTEQHKTQFARSSMQESIVIGFGCQETYKQWLQLKGQSDLNRCVSGAVERGGATASPNNMLGGHGPPQRWFAANSLEVLTLTCSRWRREGSKVCSIRGRDQLLLVCGSRNLFNCLQYRLHEACVVVVGHAHVAWRSQNWSGATHIMVRFYQFYRIKWQREPSYLNVGNA